MKQTLISVIVIGLVALTAGAGTYAYFSDTETSTGNTFTAGTLDLKIRCDGSDEYGDTGAIVWTIPNVEPGDPISSRVFRFKNTGSIVASHMEITCDYSVDEGTYLESDTDPETYQHPDEMAKYFTITELKIREDYGVDIDLLPSIVNGNGNDRKDLQDLKEAGIDTTTVPQPIGASYTTVTMELEFDETADDGVQGDEFNLTMIFTLNQHADP